MIVYRSEKMDLISANIGPVGKMRTFSPLYSRLLERAPRTNAPKYPPPCAQEQNIRFVNSIAAQTESKQEDASRDERIL